MSIVVTNQEELDAAIESGDKQIIVKSPAGVWPGRGHVITFTDLFAGAGAA